MPPPPPPPPPPWSHHLHALKGIDTHFPLPRSLSSISLFTAILFFFFCFFLDNDYIGLALLTEDNLQEADGKQLGNSMLLIDLK